MNSVESRAHKFIENAVDRHGDKYDYSKVVDTYVNAQTPVTIICPEHGEFQQRPNDHSSAGKGCKYCANNVKKTTKEWIQLAVETHGDKYDYSLVDYKNNKTDVTIICPEHGPFTTKPEWHIKSKTGCEKCGIVLRANSRKYTTEEFIEKATEVHGDSYDYGNVDYISSTDKVEIICSKHGVFLQAPAEHLNGKGCRICNPGGFVSDKPAILYYLRIDTSEGYSAYKIGITNRTVNERYRNIDIEKITIIREWQYAVGQDAQNQETKIKQEFKDYRWTGPDLLRDGNSELYSVDILNLDEGYIHE